MGTVSFNEFKNVMERAVYRQQHRYENFFAYHFRWSPEDTDSARDGQSFEQLARIMGFSTPDVDVFEERKDSLPGFEVLTRLMNFFKAAISKPGRSVILVHYAGHAYATSNEELVFSNSWGKQIKLSNILNQCLDESYLAHDEPVDMVFILDCCYSHVSTRISLPGARLVDILAAGEARDPLAFAARTANSFTSKLLVEIRNRKQRGDRWVEMADVISTLQNTSSVKRPTYAAKLGLGSVTLPLVDQAVTASSTPITVSPGYHATFSVHVSKTLTLEELRGLVAWVESCPSEARLVLENIKETNSMFLIFGSKMVCFLRICGVPGVKLICENSGSDYSFLLRQQRSIGQSRSSGRP